MPSTGSSWAHGMAAAGPSNVPPGKDLTDIYSGLNENDEVSLYIFISYCKCISDRLKVGADCQFALAEFE